MWYDYTVNAELIEGLRIQKSHNPNKGLLLFDTFFGQQVISHSCPQIEALRFISPHKTHSHTCVCVDL